MCMCMTHVCQCGTLMSSTHRLRACVGVWVCVCAFVCLCVREREREREKRREYE